MRTIISILFIFLSIQSHAYDFMVDSLCYNILESEMWEVDYPIVEVVRDNTLRYDEPDNIAYTRTSVIVPETVTWEGTEYHVVGVGRSAFGGNIKLATVSLPDGLLYIDDAAFNGRKPLRTLTIPKTVTTIGDAVFDGCTSLQKIEFPDGVTSFGKEMFTSCAALETVKLPPTLKTIKRSAFYGCKKLQTINIPETVEVIEGDAFSGCELIESIKLPDNLKKIGDSAFEMCYMLSKINIPDGVEQIGRAAFHRTAIPRFTSTPKMKEISDLLFFEGSLQYVRITSNIQRIGMSAFEYNEGLKTVRIEGGVETIAEGAFASCNGLRDFYCLTNIVPQADKTAFAAYQYQGSDGTSKGGITRSAPLGETYVAEHATLHVHRDLIDQFRKTYPWSNFKEIVAIEDETDIDPIMAADPTRSTTYDLVGRMLRQQQAGLNIILGNDGKTRKVLIR